MVLPEITSSHPRPSSESQQTRLKRGTIGTCTTYTIHSPATLAMGMAVGSVRRPLAAWSLWPLKSNSFCSTLTNNLRHRITLEHRATIWINSHSKMFPTRWTGNLMRMPEESLRSKKARPLARSQSQFQLGRPPTGYSTAWNSASERQSS